MAFSSFLPVAWHGTEERGILYQWVFTDIKTTEGGKIVSAVHTNGMYSISC
jgi:hypothetical protein